jgi:hypothetical protein
MLVCEMATRCPQSWWRYDQANHQAQSAGWRPADDEHEQGDKPIFLEPDASMAVMVVGAPRKHPVPTYGTAMATLNQAGDDHDYCQDEHRSITCNPATAARYWKFLPCCPLIRDAETAARDKPNDEVLVAASPCPFLNATSE